MIDSVSSPMSSAKIHNRNCFSYLSKVIISDRIATLLSLPESILRDFAKVKLGWDPKYPYGDAFTEFFSYIDDRIMAIYAANSDDLELQAFIFSLYHNDNGVLIETFNAIKPLVLDHVPSTEEPIEDAITEHVKDRGPKVNYRSLTPSEVGSLLRQASALVSSNFKPQYSTSLATIRRYQYNEKLPNGLYRFGVPTDMRPEEYRFGTPGQRHRGESRISQVFECWLSVHAREAFRRSNLAGIAPPSITHIYFNNLGRDRSKKNLPQNIASKKEVILTTLLENLEARHTTVAVITLPADKGLMAQGDFKDTVPQYHANALREEFLAIAGQNSLRKIKDFFISTKVRKLLFKDATGHYSEETERAVLLELLTRSFAKMGITEDALLSKACRQALWFHFIKFELTNYIIHTLQPAGVNFTCKDGIDRGGVSSAYYNLMKSIAIGHPLSIDEFGQALHAAPTMVKGRGMNSNLYVLWNAIDVYVNAQGEAIDEQCSWLRQWRDFNCPKIRVKGLLRKRVEECIQQLETTRGLSNRTPEVEAIYSAGLLVLEKIKQQSHDDVSSKRLLLEATVRTVSVIVSPTTDNIERYGKLADKLAIRFHPMLVLGGLMKAMLGLLLCALTMGQYTRTLSEGWSTMVAGWKGSERNKLFSAMKHLQNEVVMREQKTPLVLGVLGKETTESVLESDAHTDSRLTFL